jgi:Holliday junction resolvase
MLDPEHTIEIKLARARGNGAGLRVEPHEVEKILEWKRKADAQGKPHLPLWGPPASHQRPKEVLPDL